MDNLKVTKNQYNYIEAMVVSYMFAAKVEDTKQMEHMLESLDKKFDDFFQVGE